MVLVQKWPFFQLFFLGNFSQENVFYDILERVNLFLGFQNKNFKKQNNWHFCKGVMVLVQKWPFLQVYFLANIGKENVFYDILERKNTFLPYKNKKFKKSKNWHFSKGVNLCFWSKNSDFSNFLFFRQDRPGKCLLRYCRTEKFLSRL